MLSNLPARQANACKVAELYRQRWTIESMFQELIQHLCCEIRTLAYPKAALFAFSLALTAWNLLSTITASLGAVHGEEQVNQTEPFGVLPVVGDFPSHARNDDRDSGETLACLSISRNDRPRRVDERVGESCEPQEIPITPARPQEAEAPTSLLRERKACRHSEDPRSMTTRKQHIHSADLLAYVLSGGEPTHETFRK
ncbi:MAG: transposase [Planctomycetaceae bacterium]